MTLIQIGETLEAEGYSLKMVSFSAIDHYFSCSRPPFVWLETDADISVLVRLFGGIRFPGVYLADAALDTAEPPGVFYFRCCEPGESPGPSCPLLSLSRSWRSNHFFDPEGVYPQLRSLRAATLHGKKMEGSGGAGGDPLLPWWNDINRNAGFYKAAMDYALIFSRYGCGHDDISGDREKHISGSAALLQDLDRDCKPLAEWQRVYLSMILMSPYPSLGFELLKAAGFLQELWPELAAMDDVDHSKEFHPEGNVWNHTMETFRYRKNDADLILSLALLFHDSGKPLSESKGSRRFDGHAELGAGTAKMLLQKLDFPAETVHAVYYLVRNHMLPAALPRMPLEKIRQTIESPLFPVLLELYRCDESSSFKGLENYYESAAAYKNYLKNIKNPYRKADGKKIANTYKSHY